MVDRRRFDSQIEFDRFERFLSLCTPGFPAERYDEPVDAMPGAPTWREYIRPAKWRIPQETP